MTKFHTIICLVDCAIERAVKLARSADTKLRRQQSISMLRKSENSASLFKSNSSQKAWE